MARWRSSRSASTGPDRVFLDLSPARAAPPLQDQTLRFNSDSDVVRQVRLGRHENRTTRVVLDAGGVARYSVYPLYNPYRLVIDCVRASAPEAAPPPLLAAKRLSPAWARQLPSATPVNAVALREAAVVPREAPAPPRTVAPAPATASPAAAAAAAPVAFPIVGPPLPGPPTLVSADLPGIQAAVIVRAPSPAPTPPAPLTPLVSKTLVAPFNRKPLAALTPRSAAAIREAVASLPPPADATSPLGPGTIPPEELPGSVPSASAAWPPPPADKSSRTPDKNANGGFSIARQLGLGVSRIVIDPGHGGHDPGAMGKGVAEAELVLDVSLRLEKLLQKTPGHRGRPDAPDRRIRDAPGADGHRQPRRRGPVPVDSRQRERKPATRGAWKPIS